MKWPAYPLSTIATDLQPGFARQPKAGNTSLPQLRTNNVSPEGRIDLTFVKEVPASQNEIEHYSLKKGDILFNNTNSIELVGKTAFFDHDGGHYLFSNHMTRIRVNEEIADPRFVARYLFWTWKTGGFLAMVTRWVNQAAINKTMLGGVNIHLPALSEQRRIVKILDQADALRKKRSEADAKAAHILPALFYKMFGDPASNPNGWPSVSLEEVTSIIHRYPTFYGVDYITDGTPVVRISDIMNNHMLNKNIKNYVKVPKDFSNKFPLTLLEPYDLVMAVRGDTTGKLGLVPVELKGANISPNLIRISPRRDKIRSLYLFSFLLLVHNLLGQFITNTAKKSITAMNLKSMQVIVPDGKLQDRFEGVAQRLLLIEENRGKISKLIDNLWNTILHQAFTGEITTEWRESHIKGLFVEMQTQERVLSQRGEL